MFWFGSDRYRFGLVWLRGYLCLIIFGLIWLLWSNLVRFSLVWLGWVERVLMFDHFWLDLVVLILSNFVWIFTNKKEREKK